MKKGKTHYRGARLDLMKLREKNARRKARQQAGYDQRQYDKPEPSPT